MSYVIRITYTDELLTYSDSDEVMLFDECEDANEYLVSTDTEGVVVSLEEEEL